MPVAGPTCGAGVLASGGAAEQAANVIEAASSQNPRYLCICEGLARSYGLGNGFKVVLTQQLFQSCGDGAGDAGAVINHGAV